MQEPLPLAITIKTKPQQFLQHSAITAKTQHLAESAVAAGIPAAMPEPNSRLIGQAQYFLIVLFCPWHLLVAAAPLVLQLSQSLRHRR